MLTHLHHVTVAVDDLADAQRSYSRLLGRDVDLETLEDGVARRWFVVENVSLELRERGTVGPAGLAQLGFACDDLDATLCWAEERELAPHRHERPATVAPTTDASARSSEPDPVRRFLALDPSRTGGVPVTVELPSSLPLEHRSRDDSAAATALDHVVVRTVDADAARTFYETALGLRVALDREFEQWGVRLIFCRLAGLTVEIAAALPSARPESVASEQETSTRDALWGLSWRVPDADRAHARIASEGFDVSEVRPGRKPGTRVFTVRDGTCGVPTLMIEPTRD